MDVVWDESKREANLAKHGLDFVDAEDVFDSPCLERLDTRRDYGEDRWILYGRLQHLVVCLVYTERGEQTRIISMRVTTPEERRAYEQEIANRLDPA